MNSTRALGPTGLAVLLFLLCAGLCGCNSSSPASAQQPASATTTSSPAPRSSPVDGVETPGPEGEVGTITPVIASALGPGGTAGVLGTDGLYHIMYELLLTNATSASAELKSVSVLDPNGATLLTVTAADMVSSEALRLMDRTPAPNASIPPATSRILLITVAFKSQTDIPKALTHQFIVQGVNPLSSSTTASLFTYTAVPLELSGPPPIVLSPPLEGTGWFASQGPPTPDSHQSAIVPLNGKLVTAERFAVDLIRIDDSGRIVTGDTTVLTNWTGYGARVFAVGDGVVTAVRDGLPDQPPGVLPNLSVADIPGNNVLLNLGNNYFVVFAHLKPGSITVQVGQTVKAGDLIARVGNSGGSTAPHLHLHVVDGPSAIAADGVPYVYTAFNLAGIAQPGAIAGAVKGNATFPPRASLTPQLRQNQLPLGDTIVDFPSR